MVNGKLNPLDRVYYVKQKSIINNSDAIQVDIKGSDTFTLRPFHFHAASENPIQSKAFPLEVHFVHASEQGQLPVIGFMFEAGKANPTVEAVLKHVPSKVNQEKMLTKKPVSLAALIPDNKYYYRFSGLWNTPSCAEGVRWIVMKNSVSASPAQLSSFAR